MVPGTTELKAPWQKITSQQTTQSQRAQRSPILADHTTTIFLGFHHVVDIKICSWIIFKRSVQFHNVGCIASIICEVVTLEHFQNTFSVHFEFTIEAEIYATLFTLLSFSNSYTICTFFVYFNIIKSITIFIYDVNCLFLSDFLCSMEINTTLISPAFSFSMQYIFISSKC